MARKKGFSSISLEEWAGYCRRTVAMLIALAGIIFSMMAVFSCNFFTVSVDSQWLPVILGGYQVTSYDISIGLFRYTITKDSFDFVESSTCRMYDDEFLSVNYDFFDTSHAAAQFFSLFSPIFALFGAIFLCFEVVCNSFSVGFWFTAISWFLAFVFQIACFILFREKDFCHGSEAVTSCELATGAWLCIGSALLYFTSLLLLLCVCPLSRTKSSARKQTESYSNKHSDQENDNEIDYCQKPGRERFDLEEAVPPSKEQTLPTDNETVVESSVAPSIATRDFESVWGDVNSVYGRSDKIKGRTVQNDGTIQLVMAAESFDADSSVTKEAKLQESQNDEKSVSESLASVPNGIPDRGGNIISRSASGTESDGGFVSACSRGDEMPDDSSKTTQSSTSVQGLHTVTSSEQSENVTETASYDESDSGFVSALDGSDEIPKQTQLPPLLPVADDEKSSDQEADILRVTSDNNSDNDYISVMEEPEETDATVTAKTLVKSESASDISPDTKSRLSETETLNVSVTVSDMDLDDGKTSHGMCETSKAIEDSDQKAALNDCEAPERTIDVDGENTNSTKKSEEIKYDDSNEEVTNSTDLLGGPHVVKTFSSDVDEATLYSESCANNKEAEPFQDAVGVPEAENDVEEAEVINVVHPTMPFTDGETKEDESNLKDSETLKSTTRTMEPGENDINVMENSEILLASTVVQTEDAELSLPSNVNNEEFRDESGNMPESIHESVDERKEFAHPEESEETKSTEFNQGEVSESDARSEIVESGGQNPSSVPVFMFFTPAEDIKTIGGHDSSAPP